MCPEPRVKYAASGWSVIPGRVRHGIPSPSTSSYRANPSNFFDVRVDLSFVRSTLPRSKGFSG